MTTFDEREREFEKRFKHDQELHFKATVRRNKLLGLWAAEKLGLSGAEADAYAKEVVLADFDESGEEDVLAKVRGDFETKGVPPDERKIRVEMKRLMAIAMEQVMTE